MASPPSIESVLLEDGSIKPRLRGVSHLLAFGVALAACIQLLLSPARGDQHVANLVFGFSLVLMFGISGTYHCPTWSHATYRGLQRCDHASIYLLIAGSFTPMAALDLSGAWSWPSLYVMWGCALTGATLALLGVSMSRGLRSALYVVLGLVATPVVLHLPDVIGTGRTRWLVFGGVLYAVGAVVYARKWPDPRPTVFGYHEVFHLMVIAAAAVHYAVLVDVIWS